MATWTLWDRESTSTGIYWDARGLGSWGLPIYYPNHGELSSMHLERARSMAGKSNGQENGT